MWQGGSLRDDAHGFVVVSVIVCLVRGWSANISSRSGQRNEDSMKRIDTPFPPHHFMHSNRRLEQEAGPRPAPIPIRPLAQERPEGCPTLDIGLSQGWTSKLGDWLVPGWTSKLGRWHAQDGVQGSSVICSFNPSHQHHFRATPWPSPLQPA